MVNSQRSIPASKSPLMGYSSDKARIREYAGAIVEAAGTVHGAITQGAKIGPLVDALLRRGWYKTKNPSAHFATIAKAITEHNENWFTVRLKGTSKHYCLTAKGVARLTVMTTSLSPRIRRDELSENELRTLENIKDHFSEQGLGFTLAEAATALKRSAEGGLMRELNNLAYYDYLVILREGDRFSCLFALPDAIETSIFEFIHREIRHRRAVLSWIDRNKVENLARRIKSQHKELERLVKENAHLREQVALRVTEVAKLQETIETLEQMRKNVAVVPADIVALENEISTLKRRNVTLSSVYEQLLSQFVND